MSVEERRSAVPPSDRRALIAIDLGAESCRVSLLRWHEEQPVIELVHRASNAPIENGDALEWDIARIEREIDTGLRRAAMLATEGVRSIAVDGWAVDYARLDADGHLLANPRCYRDPRNVAAQAAVHLLLPPDRLREITGLQLLSINTLYQLYADQLAGFSQARWLNLPEYILYRLGARQIAEYTNATHTQLLHQRTRDWSPEIFDRLGLDRSAAATIVPPGARVGTLAPPLGDLPSLRGAELIAPACHDTASAVAGIPAHGDDWAYISSGTWSLVGTVLHCPIDTPEAREKNYTNLGAVGGRICFHRNVNGMWLIRQSIDEWRSRGREWTVAELIAAAETLPAPTALIDVDEPELLLPGNIPARINAQLARRGLAPLDESPDNAPAFASLIFHSLAARYAQVLADISRIATRTFTRLYIVGGGSRNTFLNRLTAEATGLQVICGAPESSTIGNFAVQLASLEEGADPRTGVTAEATASWAALLQ